MQYQTSSSDPLLKQTALTEGSSLFETNPFNAELRNHVESDVWWQKLDPEKRIFTGKSYSYLKRLLDLSLCFITIPIIFPLLGVIALAIKLESPNGAVFFKQKRTGINGFVFGMFKFRTMVPNAEELKKEFAHLNLLQWPDFKIENDPRITRVGNILRKTSLDELPQILNIFRGEMSFVGPRPTSFLANTYDLWQTERLDILPGLTGLWQITGRGSMEFDERVRLDIAYIRRRGLWFDLQIIFRTVLVALIQRKGAY